MTHTEEVQQGRILAVTARLDQEIALRLYAEKCMVKMMKIGVGGSVLAIIINVLLWLK